MADFLTSSEYPQVRAAIDVELDTNALPDATIGYDIYAGRANAEVKRRLADTAYDDLDASDQPIARRAAIFLCASYLAVALPYLESVGLDDLSVRVQAKDWEKLAAELRSQYEEEIGNVEETTPGTPVAPALFARVTGRRGL